MVHVAAQNAGSGSEDKGQGRRFGRRADAMFSSQGSVCSSTSVVFAVPF
jgi:hypothetical protein